MSLLGIDVSKGKSTVATLHPMDEIALSPMEYLHTEIELKKLSYTILASGKDTRVYIETTDNYHKPVATTLHKYGLNICVSKPKFSAEM